MNKVIEYIKEKSFVESINNQIPQNVVIAEQVSITRSEEVYDLRIGIPKGTSHVKITFPAMYKILAEVNMQIRDLIKKEVMKIFNSSISSLICVEFLHGCLYSSEIGNVQGIYTQLKDYVCQKLSKVDNITITQSSRLIIEQMDEEEIYLKDDHRSNESMDESPQPTQKF